MVEAVVRGLGDSGNPGCASSLRQNLGGPRDGTADEYTWLPCWAQSSIVKE